MKKSRKLTLQKETLIDLQKVAGGQQSEIIYTVYYPVETDFCTRGCPVWV